MNRLSDSHLDPSMAKVHMTPRSSSVRLVRFGGLALAIVLSLLALAVVAAPSQAAFGVAHFDGEVVDANGDPFSQAGGHPYAITTTIELNKTINSEGQVDSDGAAKDYIVDLPAGFLGDPTAVPRCSAEAFEDQNNADDVAGETGGAEPCPGASQVGIIKLFMPTPSGDMQWWKSAVYNIEPGAGKPAQFGFSVTQAHIRASGTIRVSPDYGVVFSVRNASQGVPISKTELTLWGVPADPSHDAERYCSQFVAGCASTAALRPFLTNPTSCTGPLTTTLRTRSWQNPEDWKTYSFVSHDNGGNPLGMTGCDRLEFNPSLKITPDVASANSPTGLTARLHIPQNEDRNGLATAHLRKAVVTLPAGVTINPATADGLAACTPAQIQLDTDVSPSCPDGSKTGTVNIDTPVLDDPLTGSIFVAAQNDNPFGTLLAIYVVAEGSGTTVKLAGRVDLDPITGRLVTTFDDNPQMPFSDLELKFWGGPRGALATPSGCGTYETSAAMSPWSGTPDVVSTSSFDINANCAVGFSPSFKAGVADNQAGASSPFTLTFARGDSDEEFGGLSASLPRGLIGKLAGVTQCSDAQAAAASCPADSQVGTVTAGSGVGSAPIFLPGKAYLTGPYKGAPFGLAVVVPAKAGPFDLGNVVVRQALHIDPVDAHVSAVSDAFPTILQGIPLKIRRVDVKLDRAGFMQNPTSCRAGRISAAISSTQNKVANLGSPFQAKGCDLLAFKPKLAMRFVASKAQRKSGGHPAFKAQLTARRGDANLKAVKVTLPKTIALDPDNANDLCEHADGLKNQCPATSAIGRARAVTPLLNRPLSGKVYFVKGLRTTARGAVVRTLPTLLIDLRGEANIQVRAKSSVDKRGRLVSTFPALPDAAVSKFNLSLDGGGNGILVVTGNKKNLCKGKQRAAVAADGHNGKVRDFTTKIATGCKAKKRNKKRN